MTTTPWFFDLQIMALCTSIFTILAVALLIFVFPRSALFWKEAEVIWVAVAVAGAGTAIYAKEQGLFDSSKLASEHRLVDASKNLERSMTYALFSGPCIQWTLYGEETQRPVNIATPLQLSQCKWMANAYKSFIGSNNQNLHVSFLNKLGYWPSGTSNRDPLFNKFKIAWDDYERALRNINPNNESKYASWIEVLTNVLGVLFFSGALAIKIAKTFAEILIEAAKKPSAHNREKFGSWNYILHFQAVCSKKSAEISVSILNFFKKIKLLIKSK